MNVVKDNQMARETSVQLRTITRLFTELQQLSFACCDVNSATQCALLTTLEREGPQTLTALTRSLNLDKAWLSRTTDQLVEDGLLLKMPHPGDRRALLVELTEAGHQAAHALNGQLNAQADRVLQRLSDEDRPQVVQLLGKLKAALEAELEQGREDSL
ncbi:MarR family winged helix-turn-helix transcriptional regulator [Deinococcus piscis]|nr:MarR family transcriptional regulator [Deinococcus piscis]